MAGPRHIMRFHFPHWFASPRRDLNIKPNNTHIERDPASYLALQTDRTSQMQPSCFTERVAQHTRVDACGAGGHRCVAVWGSVGLLIIA